MIIKIFIGDFNIIPVLRKIKILYTTKKSGWLSKWKKAIGVLQYVNI